MQAETSATAQPRPFRTYDPRLEPIAARVLAIDPLRAEGIRFTAPYVLIEGAYLVRNGSPLTANDQVDRPGARIVVGRGSAYDLYLSRALKSAQLVRAPTAKI